MSTRATRITAGLLDVDLVVSDEPMIIESVVVTNFLAGDVVIGFEDNSGDTVFGVACKEFTTYTITGPFVADKGLTALALDEWILVTVFHSAPGI